MSISYTNKRLLRSSCLTTSKTIPDDEMKETRRKLQEYFNKENNYEDNLTNISIESE